MASRTYWMNVYRAGWFHREGKPFCVDVHPGDFYCSYDDAVAEIDKDQADLYVATVPFQADFGDVQPNPADSVPTPLSKSRARIVAERAAKRMNVAEVQS